MENKISFRGTFLLKKPAPNTASAIREALGRGSIIYEKIGDQAKDILVVTRNNKDSIAAEYIKQNGLDFNYYPLLDTKSGFVPNQAQRAIDLIRRCKAKYTRNIKHMMMTINKNKNKSLKVCDTDGYPHLTATLKRFGLEAPEFSVREKIGMHEVRNKNKEIVARISCPNGAKRHYIELVDPNSDMPTMKYEMDANGEITDRFKALRTPEFMRKFIAAAKYNELKR